MSKVGPKSLKNSHKTHVGTAYVFFTCLVMSRKSRFPVKRAQYDKSVPHFLQDVIW